MKNDDISLEVAAFVIPVFSLWPRLSTRYLILLNTTLCTADYCKLQAHLN